MKKLIFILVFSALSDLALPIFGQGEPDAGYPAVSSWLKEQKIVLDTNPEKASIEKAHLNNIRSVFIQNGIPSAEYVAVLNDALVGFYKRLPDPSDHRTAVLWGMRNLILEHLSLLVQRPAKVLDNSRLPTVDQWLKENKLEVKGASEEAPWELANLHNLRILALVHDIPKESYRAMLNDCILPILKGQSSGLARRGAIERSRFILIFPDANILPKKSSKPML